MTYQIQTLTWRGGMPYQQDAVLVNTKIYQHKGVISTLDKCDDFCVADGVAVSPKSDITSRTLLQLVQTMYDEQGAVDFGVLQHRLNDTLADKAGFDGGSSTLVCAYTDNDGVMIKHLGDSRAYLFRDDWHCLTKDHSFINELKAQNLADDSDHASCYGALTGYFCVDGLGDESAVAMVSHQNIKLQAGECLLLCSDGFCDVLKGNFLPITKDLPLNEWLNDSIKQLNNLEQRHSLITSA
ncbi:protein phosphatase 2C domain-containing protein [Moraxella bovis]|uniref:PP2C family protein-serine/threonine phosphatase n=1 Tax=Moraxella bovis TaxID=476 RepID=UPI0022260BCF|nr:protein phosphatase 2C domain-containing protein [Moraxella bovis]UZA26130.1 protein phosphatase 2C domain-containing protein [Moraxella bovis]UZA30976.1 protein phosphatase 2C domain-containing protein [Moraxella bovis]